MNTVAELLRLAREQLQTDENADAALESQLLLAHVIGRDRSWLFAHPEAVIPDAVVKDFRHQLARRAQGTPVAHLVDRREFWSLEFEVTADTLIPRPETEHLVDAVLALDVPDDARVLDLGTGSGVIALALASERPTWRIIATDRSAAAIDVARRNANRLQLGEVRFRQGDWFEALEPTDGPFDVIVSNPPYVSSDDPHVFRGDLRFEPSEALTSGVSGLDDIRAIIDRAPAFLAPRAWLWLEHGATQDQAVANLLETGGFRQLAQVHDLAGLPRISGGRLA